MCLVYFLYKVMQWCKNYFCSCSGFRYLKCEYMFLSYIIMWSFSALHIVCQNVSSNWENRSINHLKECQISFYSLQKYISPSLNLFCLYHCFKIILLLFHLIEVMSVLVWSRNMKNIIEMKLLSSFRKLSHWTSKTSLTL
jgi:hypothetical protein